jgi:hypothetical protein
MLRLPASTIDIDECRLYCLGPAAEVRCKQDWIDRDLISAACAV